MRGSPAGLSSPQEVRSKSRRTGDDRGTDGERPDDDLGHPTSEEGIRYKRLRCRSDNVFIAEREIVTDSPSAQAHNGR